MPFPCLYLLHRLPPLFLVQERDIYRFFLSKQLATAFFRGKEFRHAFFLQLFRVSIVGFAFWGDKAFEGCQESFFAPLLLLLPSTMPCLGVAPFSPASSPFFLFLAERNIFFLYINSFPRSPSFFRTTSLLLASLKAFTSRLTFVPFP